MEVQTPEGIKIVPDEPEIPAPELTPEQIEAQERFFRSFVIRRNQFHLRCIYNYLHDRKLTLQDVFEEVQNKKCRLSAAQREFIVGFKLDFIDQLLLDMYGDYYRASNPVEESVRRSEVDSKQEGSSEGAE